MSTEKIERVIQLYEDKYDRLAWVIVAKAYEILGTEGYFSTNDIIKEVNKIVVEEYGWCAEEILIEIGIDTGQKLENLMDIMCEYGLLIPGNDYVKITNKLITE